MRSQGPSRPTGPRGRGTEDERARRVLDLVDELVNELHPHHAPAATLDSDLEHDLGLDSLAVAELLVRLENDFSVSLPDHTLQHATTARDLAQAIGPAARLSAKPRPAHAIEATPTRQPRGMKTLVESLAWHAETHPGRLHVRVLAEDNVATELTYAELTRAARATGAGLAELGVAPGDSVAVMLPTGRDYFVTFLGILLAGAVAVPLYPPSRPAQLEEHLRRQTGILRNARATLLVSPPEARPLTRLVRSSVETLRELRSPSELSTSASSSLPVAQPDDIALLQYTSGSTGNPKGVVLSHRHLLTNIEAMARAARAEPEDIFVSWLPLYHDLGLIGAWLGSLHLGMPLVAMSPAMFLMRPVRWLQAISEHRGTLSAAPNFAFELCLRRVQDEELAALDLSRWRIAFNGAEAVNPSTLRRFTRRFEPCGLRAETLLPVYGLAEAAVGLCFSPPGRPFVVDRIERAEFLDSGRARPAQPEDPEAVEFASCGLPLPGYEVRVVDDTDHEQPDRTEGHIQFQGPSVTSGYFRNPEATHELFHGDWLDTGDLGYVADGELYVTGREKDLIVRAGRNLHPDELEAAVGQLPGVRKGCVAVFGVPDEATGTERLVVVAETHETEPGVLADLRNRVIATTVELLATPPDEVVFAAPGTVPKTSSGKIRRAEARSRFEHSRLRPERRSISRQLSRFVFFGLPARWVRFRHAMGDDAHALVGWAILVGIGIPLGLLLMVPGRRLRWRLVKAAVRCALVLSRTPVRVHGADRLPQGPAIIVANHASWADGIALIAALPEPLRFVAGEVFARQRVVGFMLGRIGTAFIQRWDREQSVADANRLAELAKDSEHLVVFAEGGLASLPGLRPFHLGAFVAAATAQVPVVPIAIRGTRRIVRPGHVRLQRGVVDVVVTEPRWPRGSDWHAAVELKDAARAEIRRHCGEPDLE